MFFPEGQENGGGGRQGCGAGLRKMFFRRENVIAECDGKWRCGILLRSENDTTEYDSAVWAQEKLWIYLPNLLTLKEEFLLKNWR
jgi:hypothetical protein